MCSAPHTDGLLMIATGDIDVDSSNLVKARNAKGDWSFNRTAAGAETYNCRVAVDQLLRTGETYVLDLFGDPTKQTFAPAAPDKGLSILDFFVIYSVGVVNLTSATLRLGKTVYSSVAGGGAFTQTDLVAATGIQTTQTPAANQYTRQAVAFQTNSSGTPLVFNKDDLGLLEIEANFVMANTGTLRVVALGAHCFFNYN